MRPYHTPGLRAWNYFSAAQSPWHVWFEELGFPQLDITRYEDGEWCIIEYMYAPLIPAEVKYRVVLAGLRNIEINWEFIKRYVDECDPTSARFWQNVERQERLKDAEWETAEQNAIDRAHRAARFVTQNPALMNRIAKRGIAEMSLSKIRREIPNYKF